METYRWIWALLTISSLAWYSTITIYIAFKGLIDIKQMLKNLGRGEFDAEHHGGEQSVPN